MAVSRLFPYLKVDPPREGHAVQVYIYIYIYMYIHIWLWLWCSCLPKGGVGCGSSNKRHSVETQPITTLGNLKRGQKAGE